MEEYKKLYGFAVKEYKEKKPKNIQGYMIKKRSIFSKGFSPSFQLQSQLTLQISYLIIVNYGSTVRVYYFSSELLQLGAKNLNSKEFMKMMKKIKKSVKKIFEVPHKTKEQLIEEKRTAYSKIISHLKHLRLDFKELQEKFDREHKAIRKKTGLKGKLKTVTLTDKKLTNIKRFGVMIKESYLYISLYCLNSKYLNIIVFREIILSLLPGWIDDSLKIDLAFLGTCCLISATERDLLLEKWSPPGDPNLIRMLDGEKLVPIIGFLAYLNKYIDIPSLTEEETKILFRLMLEEHSRGHAWMAERFFSNLVPDNEITRDIFIAKRLLFRFLSGEHVEANQIKFGTFSKPCLSLATRKLFDFYETYQRLEKIPRGLNHLIQDVLKKINPVQITRNFTRKDKSWIELSIIISNNSDLILAPKKIRDSSYSGLDVKGDLNFKKLYPESVMELKIQVNLPEGQSFTLSPIQLTLIDDFKNEYHVKVPSMMIH